MATLVTRAGDPQALKIAAAAAAAGAPLEVLPLSDEPAWRKLLAADAQPTFGQKQLFLVLPDGSILEEPNAAARYLAGAPASAAEASWVEWEAAVLRPAVYSGDAAHLAAALRKLSGAAAGGTRLAAKAKAGPGLADLAVYGTLSALRGAPELAGVQGWLDALAAEPALASAAAAVDLGAGAGAAAGVLAADRAAAAAAAPRLPVPGKRNILITSALPYVNNVPHLGNIIGCVLSADVYSRFCRARGHNSVFVCGTDEYGTATETKALEEGLTCAEVCDKYHAIHAAIYKWFDIAFDKFGRTPSRAQTAIGQAIFADLEASGFLLEQEMDQLYSEPLKKFLADRFVVGTCPRCKYEDARGDQCDACGGLLNPTELINPKCKLTGSTPVVRSTRHVFLDLPRLAPELQAYIDATSRTGGWSSNCVQVTNAWMSQGLKPRCITRDLRWGTPVPKPGFEDKVFYVWFDAPIGYVSITAGYCGDAWRAWWQNPEEVELVQFMGKDNVPFHTVIFPATQLGTRRPWTMMKAISVTEYLNYEDGKFSKSRGVGVFGNDAMGTGIPADVWRYYLLAVRPETADSAFQWDDFAAKANAELNDNLGNFLNRTLKFVHARFGGAVPGADPAGAGAGPLAGLGERLGSLVSQYLAALEGLRMKEALRAAMMVSKAGNAFFQETEIWAVYKTDVPAASSFISACAGVAALLAALLQPFMPSFTARLLAQLGAAQPLPLADDLPERARRPAELLPAGHAIAAAEPTPLFRKIGDAEAAALRERFAGNQADRAAAAPAGSSASSAPPGGKPGRPTDGAAKPAAAGSKAKAAADGKAAAAAAAADGPASSKAAAAAAAAGGKDKAAGGGGKKGKEEDRPVDISRLDLRVGLIRKAWRHPDADSLYVEEVDCGEAEPRTVVSGLVRFIPEDQMQGRRVVLVCNLKPAAMRGIKSQAMVLAATSPDGQRVELVEPPAGAAPGDRVSVAGYPGEPDEQLNPKKKVFEAIQPDLVTDAARVATFKGAALATPQGPCTVASIVGGSIK